MRPGMRERQLRAVSEQKRKRGRHEFEEEAGEALPKVKEEESEGKKSTGSTRSLAQTIASRKPRVALPSSFLPLLFENNKANLHGCHLRPRGATLEVREATKRRRRERTSSSKSTRF